jgi:type II secretory pathway pseudopilin PulG
VTAKHRCGRDRGGYTIIELIIATAVAFIVVLALGRIIVANQRSWEWGRDKIVLQQNATEALEWMARSIRAARTIALIDSTGFRTYDEGNGLVHTYRTVGSAGRLRLQEDGRDLVDRRCTAFSVRANHDTTTLSLWLELEDVAGNRVAGMTRTALRNRTFEF